MSGKGKMKLLITDLDGTFYPKNDNETKDQLHENVAAAKKWVAAGNIFAVATARGVGHYDTICDTVGFKINFLGGNGAENIFEDGTIQLKSFPISIFFKVCNFIKRMNIDSSASTIYNRHWYWSSKDHYPIYNSDKPRWQHVEILEPYSIDENLPIERIAVFVKKESLVFLTEELKKEFGSFVHITSSDEDTIDIGSLNSSKGLAVIELAKRYNISKEDIIVIGDSENDLTMFEEAHVSYCMSHADKHVIEKATYTVDSFSQAVFEVMNKDKSLL